MVGAPSVIYFKLLAVLVGCHALFYFWFSGKQTSVIGKCLIVYTNISWVTGTL
jgi:hypothetical protein